MIEPSSTEHAFATRKGDSHLVILAEVEVAREPGLDATVLTDELDKFACGGATAMVQPAAAVDYVVLL